VELRIGLYAFFAYSLSGVAYFAVGLLMLEGRWPGTIAALAKEWPLPVLLVATALCYFAGLVLDPLARLLFRIFYQRYSKEIAIEGIAKHYPEASSLNQEYWPLLLAELHLSKEGLVELADVYKAASTLLRNIGTAGVAGAAVVLVGLIRAPSQLAFWVACSLATIAFLAFRESRKFDSWFYSSICERILVLRVQKAVSPKLPTEPSSLRIGSVPASHVTTNDTAADKR